ncbi:hypothetical protein FF38_06278 [Lucilia cuprina]|uniref:Uncharacterized protein n=1 Tax=Lucilia cuprina TaxID=7375 RepID=A0A0L0C0B1_LUCCU|nr:hypothetical protein FF38_06278 [Lucilia cuprina]
MSSANWSRVRKASLDYCGVGFFGIQYASDRLLDISIEDILEKSPFQDQLELALVLGPGNEVETSVSLWSKVLCLLWQQKQLILLLQFLTKCVLEKQLRHKLSLDSVGFDVAERISVTDSKVLYRLVRNKSKSDHFGIDVLFFKPCSHRVKVESGSLLEQKKQK